MEKGTVLLGTGHSSTVRLLTEQGFRAVLAKTNDQVQTYLKGHTPDLLVLELPESQAICHHFRERSDNPVILILAEDSPEERIAGLRSGADYFLPLTFCPEELLAAANRLLERRETLVLRKGALALDRLRGTVTLNGENIHLTSREFGLLQLLMQNEGKEVSMEQMYEAVWNTAPGRDMRTIRKHIMNLREKIRAGETDDYDIVTVYRKGYIFQ